MENAPRKSGQQGCLNIYENLFLEGLIDNQGKYMSRPKQAPIHMQCKVQGKKDAEESGALISNYELRITP